MIDELVELHGCIRHDAWLLRRWVSVAQPREVMAGTSLGVELSIEHRETPEHRPRRDCVRESSSSSDTDGAASTTTWTSPHGGRSRTRWSNTRYRPGGQLRQVSPGQMSPPRWARCAIRSCTALPAGSLSIGLGANGESALVPRETGAGAAGVTSPAVRRPHRHTACLQRIVGHLDRLYEEWAGG